MQPVYITAAGRCIGGTGSLDAVEQQIAHLQDRHLAFTALTIDPLAADLEPTTAPDHYRGGNAPLEALSHAHKLLQAGEADYVLLYGRDDLRSEYSAQQRQQLLEYYGPQYPLAQAYTDLARAFIAHTGLNHARFLQLRDRLWHNLLGTARRQPGFQEPAAQAFEPVTELFRQVDCPRTEQDFEGALLLTHQAGLAEFDLQPRDCIRVLGVGIGLSHGEGPDSINELAHYRALQKAVFYACLQAHELDFAAAFRDGNALLESDTCYPVVPLGFLLASGIATHPDQLEPLLQERELTVTGGQYLAGAFAHNTALNGLLALVERLRTDAPPLGGVHGNGGLGERQGFVILGRPD